MNKNLICMLLYFIAAGLLFGYAFTSNSLCLYGGVIFLVGAIALSKMTKK